VVHSVGIDEIGHVDVLRPFVERVISVPRVHGSTTFRGTGEFPASLYENYIPEMRRVIELELASGRYDLVDYEY
jgi:hypothetical protein